MKKSLLILVGGTISMLLILSSCKKDEEAKPDDTTVDTGNSSTTAVTNYLLQGTWEPTHSDAYICDNKKDYYTFSSTEAKLYGCDDGDPFTFKHSMSSDGKVFKLENLFTEKVETYTVTEFTETTMKANKGSVKFYLKKR